MMAVISEVHVTSADGAFRSRPIAEAMAAQSEGVGSAPLLAHPPGVNLPSDVLQSVVKSTADVVIWPLHRLGEWVDEWARLPASVAVRVRPVEEQAVTIFPSPAPLRNAGGELSLWRMVIEHVDAGGAVRVESPPAGIGIPTAGPPLLQLVPSSPSAAREWLRRELTSDAATSAAGSPVQRTALAAGLLQMHDFLDASHEQSQSIEGGGGGGQHDGDYWHGIMHRREPDYANAKYWFRQVGTHPVFAELAKPAAAILEACPDDAAEQWRHRLVGSAGWDPQAFVDLCAECAGNEDSDMALAARQIQWLEMRLLLLHIASEA